MRILTNDIINVILLTKKLREETNLEVILRYKFSDSTEPIVYQVFQHFQAPIQALQPYKI